MKTDMELWHELKSWPMSDQWRAEGAAAERERWIRLAVETHADPPCECEHPASAHDDLGNGDLGQCQAVCECEGYAQGSFEAALRRAGGAERSEP